MKHEHFKSFTDAVEIEAFLQGGHITPKSISVIRRFREDDITIIGYVDSKSEHIFAIEFEVILNVEPENIASVVETAAKKHKGVICQDVELNETELYLTFLIQK
jgi:hypothetical protein